MDQYIKAQRVNWQIQCIESKCRYLDDNYGGVRAKIVQAVAVSGEGSPGPPSSPSCSSGSPIAPSTSVGRATFSLIGSGRLICKKNRQNPCPSDHIKRTHDGPSAGEGGQGRSGGREGVKVAAESDVFDDRGGDDL